MNKKIQIQKINLFAGILVVVSVVCLPGIWNLRTAFEDKMQSITRVVGHQAESALLFEDAQGAAQVLEAIHEEQEIMLACLYRIDNTLLAHYSAKAKKEADISCPPGFKEDFSGSVSTFHYAIRDINNENAGTIVVAGSLAPVDKRIMLGWALITLVALGALWMTLIPAWKNHYSLK